MQGGPPLGPGALVIASLYLVSSGNKGSDCVQMDNVENNEASGSDTVKPTTTRATQALVLSSQLFSAPSPNCGELAGARRREAGGSELRALLNRGWREEERDEAGSGRWSLIRD